MLVTSVFVVCLSHSMPFAPFARRWQASDLAPIDRPSPMAGDGRGAHQAHPAQVGCAPERKDHEAPGGYAVTLP